MEISAKLVSYQDVFKCEHMWIFSQTVLIMHNTAWAVLMFKTLAKREERKKSTNLFFCVWILQQKQIAKKNKARMGRARIQNRRAKEICGLCMCFEYKAQAAVMAVRVQGGRHTAHIHIQYVVIRILWCIHTHMPWRDTCSLPRMYDLRIRGQHPSHHASCEVKQSVPT